MGFIQISIFFDKFGLYFEAESGSRPFYFGITIPAAAAELFLHLGLQGYQVTGPVLKNPKTGSRVNLVQINFVAEKIIPAMQALYGNQMRKKCMIVIGYAEGIDRMHEAFPKLRSLHANLTSNMMPIVQTNRLGTGCASSMGLLRSDGQRG